MTDNRYGLKTAKWCAYFAILLGLYCIQVMPGWFAVCGIKPVLLVPWVICAAMMETDRFAAVLALVAGGIWDAGSMRYFGFSSLVLLICAVTCSLLILYLVRCNLTNAIFFTFCTLCFYDLIDLLFRFVIWGRSGVGWYLLYHILPTVLYTLLITPLLYGLMYKLSGWFAERLSA